MQPANSTLRAPGHALTLEFSEAGPAAYDDEGFGVHFAFFAQTDAEVRLRILEGRRHRVT